MPSFLFRLSTSSTMQYLLTLSDDVNVKEMSKIFTRYRLNILEVAMWTMLTSKKFWQCRQCKVNIGSISYEVMLILYQYCIQCSYEKERCIKHEWQKSVRQSKNTCIFFFYYRVLKRLSESEIQNKDILEERSLNLKLYFTWNKISRKKIH